MRARRSPDYHLTKPWLLDQDLYRAVSEFLADWARDTEPGFQLFRVIGDEPDRGSHELRGLLTRFNVPFSFHLAGREPGRHLLAEHGLDPGRLPVLIRHDGRRRPAHPRPGHHRGGRQHPQRHR